MSPGDKNVLKLFERSTTEEKILCRLTSKIVDVKVGRGIMGKRFDFGTVIILGADGTRDAFHRIAAPNELRREIVERIPSK